MKHEELVQLLQEGRIGHLQFVMDGDNAKDYLRWCEEHGTDQAMTPQSSISSRPKSK